LLDRIVLRRLLSVLLADLEYLLLKFHEDVGVLLEARLTLLGQLDVNDLLFGELNVLDIGFSYLVLLIEVLIQILDGQNLARHEMPQNEIVLLLLLLYIRLRLP
jgi:hypothetical protein